jgi:hypothetical protein
MTLLSRPLLSPVFTGASVPHEQADDGLVFVRRRTADPTEDPTRETATASACSVCETVDEALGRIEQTVRVLLVEVSGLRQRLGWESPLDADSEG